MVTMARKSLEDLNGHRRHWNAEQQTSPHFAARYPCALVGSSAQAPVGVDDYVRNRTDRSRAAGVKCGHV